MTCDFDGARLGEFEVMRELGRGSMGVVYEAVQTSLGRRVALKVLASGVGLTPRAVDRFRREAAAAAKLHHSNIVPVYATGEHRGVYFYAMELVEGPSLDRVIAQMRQARSGVASSCDAATPGLPPQLGLTGPYVETPPSTTPAPLTSSALSGDHRYFDQVAETIADVAETLDHAHRNNVLHRDVKPSNLLLAPDGRLSVNDFGLARLLEEPGMTVKRPLLLRCRDPLNPSPRRRQLTTTQSALDRRRSL